MVSPAISSVQKDIKLLYLVAYIPAQSLFVLVFSSFNNSHIARPAIIQYIDIHLEIKYKCSQLQIIDKPAQRGIV